MPNFKGCRLQIPSGFNFRFLDKELSSYHDKIVVDLLRFGFPLDHNNITGSNVIPSNHAGARNFPNQIRGILNKEIETGATIGPFRKSPFGDNICISPLNSVPKKDSRIVD